MEQQNPRNVYVGIFADEVGQQLLAHSMAQLDATLGTAWSACDSKENKMEVFGRCMDLVDSWNEKTFAEEASSTFSTRPRSDECWRTAFGGYVRQVYRGSKHQVRATVPNSTAYVQTLLTTAAQHPVVRSGRYFDFESTLDKKDVAMDVIRQGLSTLCGEFVYEEPLQATEASQPDVDPDDSASQVGVRAYRAAQQSAGSATSKRQSENGSAVSEQQSNASEGGSSVPSAVPAGTETEAPETKSVTIKTTIA